MLGGDVQHAVIPRQLDFLGLEARHVDCEDELVVLLVQFVVAPSGVPE